jgi:hypothetical protein
MKGSLIHLLMGKNVWHILPPRISVGNCIATNASKCRKISFLTSMAPGRQSLSSCSTNAIVVEQDPWVSEPVRIGVIAFSPARVES